MRTKDQIKADIEKLIDKCKGYKTCQDGSYGACLDYGGMAKLRKELEEFNKAEYDRLNKEKKGE